MKLKVGAQYPTLRDFFISWIKPRDFGGTNMENLANNQNKTRFNNLFIPTSSKLPKRG